MSHFLYYPVTALCATHRTSFPPFSSRHTKLNVAKTKELGSVTDPGGFSESVKGFFLELLDFVGQLLGMSTGGGRDKRSSNMLMGDSFKAAFETKYGKT